MKVNSKNHHTCNDVMQCCFELPLSALELLNLMQPKLPTVGRNSMDELIKRSPDAILKVFCQTMETIHVT